MTDNDIDLKESLRKEVQKIYTPLSVAKEEIWKRWGNKELRKNVSEFLGIKAERFFKESPVACLGRNIVSPTMEFSYFLELAKEIDLEPLVIEHVKDKFVTENPDKYYLAKLYFYNKNGRKNDRNIDADFINAIDFNKYQGEKICNINTMWGENLVDFQHRISHDLFPNYWRKSIDISEILDLNHKGLSQCYDKYLALFIFGGVLFENFLLSKNIKDFTHRVVVPAFAKLEKLFGIKPLIVPLSPIEDQDDLYWWCYPTLIKDDIMEHITIGGAKYRKIHYREFKNALIQLKPSRIVPTGVGVFAVRNLSKGIIIGDVRFLSEDFFLTRNDYEKVDQESRGVIKNFCIPTPDGFFAPKDVNYLSIPWYINHSCDGNVGYDKNGNFVTIKNVKKDDELSYDYGLAVSDPGFKLYCKCRSEKCRKVITGNDWKNVEYRKKNYSHMTPELKELIEKTYKD